jgi:hypothetical protein
MSKQLRDYVNESSLPSSKRKVSIIDISKILKSWQHRKQTHITWKGYCDQNTSSSKTDTLIYVITKLETIYAETLWNMSKQLRDYVNESSLPSSKRKVSSAY